MQKKTPIQIYPISKIEERDNATRARENRGDEQSRPYLADLQKSAKRQRRRRRKKLVAFRRYVRSSHLASLVGLL